MGIQSSVLIERMEKQLGLTRPTSIQAKSFDAIRNDASSVSRDVTIGAETGSGKSYAYLLPLLDAILEEKAQVHAGSDNSNLLLPSYDYARAVILVPNKELVHQVLRMAVPLCGGTIRQSLVWGASGTGLLEQLEPVATNKQGQEEADLSKIVRLAIMQGGLMEPLDFKPFRDSVGLGGDQPPVDIVITTPAALGPLALKPKHIDLFADIETLIVDEADMLLDGGYIRALENVLMGFRRADRLQVDFDGAPPKKTQHVFVAATLPDMGLKSVDAYLQRKFPHAKRIHTDNMHNAKHYGLAQPTQWYELETKKERMERLVEMLQTDKEEGGLQGEKVMVFLNSVEDVEAVHQALEQRDIDAVPYHAKISLQDRSKNLEKFRFYNNGSDTNIAKATVPVLVCTDLASRGLDVPGVTAVVQLQFSGNVVSHLHRMGRCGRAGQRTGRGIVFYSEEEKDLVEVVKEAEEQQERMDLKQDVDDRDEDGNMEEIGKVKKAFSRKRGFTKKRKKLKREGEVA
jgi:superfamily II DNA/RNA helicase